MPITVPLGGETLARNWWVLIALRLKFRSPRDELERTAV